MSPGAKRVYLRAVFSVDKVPFIPVNEDFDLVCK